MKQTVSKYSVTGNIENVNMSQKFYIHSSFERLSLLHTEVAINQNQSPK